MTPAASGTVAAVAIASSLPSWRRRPGDRSHFRTMLTAASRMRASAGFGRDGERGSCYQPPREPATRYREDRARGYEHHGDPDQHRCQELTPPPGPSAD